MAANDSGAAGAPLPKCIGFIMDGNRNFAKRKGLFPVFSGHSQGLSKATAVLSWCRDSGIRNVVLFVLSTENFSREKDEFNYLLGLLKSECEKILSDESHEANKGGVRVRFIGRLGLLPDDLRVLCRKVEEKTRGNSDYGLFLAVAYGGRAEIMDAFEKAASSGAKKLDEESLKRFLYAPEMPFPDLVIRTGGVKRISNFLLWQTAYSELCFVESSWPEFSREEFEFCLRDFSSRKRNFGK